MQPEHMVWWHVYPLGFLGAEGRRPDDGVVRHRLPALGPWLDYLLRLGCNGLMLGPVFASVTHGYDTLDHRRIDDRLGDLADFDALLAECRRRGIALMLDGVFNHLAREHAIVQRAITEGPDSEPGRWIRWRAGAPVAFEGHAPLVELDFAHPPVQQFIAGVMIEWLERGVAAWRLDAAYRAGASAWAPMVAAVRRRFPDAWLMGEVIHGDYGRFVAESGLSSVTQYELWKAVWSSLNDGNLHELAWAIQRNQRWHGQFLPTTFIGNHDVTRIASQLTDPRHLGHAVALLALLPGMPCIYAGDEQGFHGVKEHRAGGDDAIRPAFPAAPGQLAPWGAAIFETHQRLFGIRRRLPWLAQARASLKAGSGLQAELHVEGAAGESVRVALNLADQPMPRPPGQVLAASGQRHDAVEPHGWLVTA
ncbi:MAG: alpha-amylase family glycosyl hydrolase [Rubrivivax sp.]